MDDCDWLLSVEKACDWLRIEPGVTGKFFLGHPVYKVKMQDLAVAYRGSGISIFIILYIYIHHKVPTNELQTLPLSPVLVLSIHNTYDE